MAKKIRKFAVTTDPKKGNRHKKADEAVQLFFYIMPMLFTRGYVRAKEIAAEFGISERKAQRVTKPFREMSILRQDEFDQGKWLFNDHRHRFDKAAIYGNDAAVLYFLMKFAKAMGSFLGKEVRESIDKNFVLHADEYPFFVITSRVKDPDTGLKFYKDLMDSIQERKKINLTYLSKGANKTVKAWPMFLVLCDGMWYLAYLPEPERGQPKEIRTLRYTHITAVEQLVGEEFDRPAWVKPALKEARNIWFNACRDRKVVLEADNAVKDYFKLSEYFPLQKIVSEGPKTFRVETHICNEMEAIPNILRFIPYVRVVSPPSLKAAVQARVKEYLK